MNARIVRMFAAMAMLFGMLILPTAALAATASAQVAGIVQISSRSPAVLSYSSGSVTIGSCSGDQISTYSTSSVVKPVKLASVTDVQYCSGFANGGALADKSGRLYVTGASTKPNNYDVRLLAFNSNGSLRWNIDPPSTGIVKMALGADGNLYGVSGTLNGREQRLFGYSNLGGSAPNLLFDKTLVANGEREAVNFATYSNGLIVRYNNALVEYFNYDGNANGSINVPNTWYVGEFNVGLSGQVYLL